jgi:hypothetical protein
MNFARWQDFALIGAISGLGAAFGGASFDWKVAAICIPAGALTGAAIAFVTRRWSGPVG